MQKEKRNNAVLKLTSSRRVGMRDINALLIAPISRISSRPQGRNDEGGSGFTLIELLVVVLIIGILAAIALPQYQRTVFKSQYNRYKVLGKALAEAEEFHYLEKGKYTTNIADLNVAFAEEFIRSSSLGTGQREYEFPWGTISLISKQFDAVPRVMISSATKDISFDIYLVQDSKSSLAGKQICNARTNQAEQLCKQETHKTRPDKSNIYGKYYAYP